MARILYAQVQFPGKNPILHMLSRLLLWQGNQVHYPVDPLPYNKRNRLLLLLCNRCHLGLHKVPRYLEGSMVSSSTRGNMHPLLSL